MRPGLHHKLWKSRKPGRRFVPSWQVDCETTSFFWRGSLLDFQAMEWRWALQLLEEHRVCEFLFADWGGCGLECFWRDWFLKKLLAFVENLKQFSVWQQFLLWGVKKQTSSAGRRRNTTSDKPQYETVFGYTFPKTGPGSEWCSYVEHHGKVVMDILKLRYIHLSLVLVYGFWVCLSFFSLRGSWADVVPANARGEVNAFCMRKRQCLDVSWSHSEIRVGGKLPLSSQMIFLGNIIITWHIGQVIALFPLEPLWVDCGSLHVTH